MDTRARLFDNTKNINNPTAWIRNVTVEMTKREQDVFRLLVQGKTNKQIAGCLGISDFTVRDYVSVLLRKKNVNTRMELIALYHGVVILK